MTLQERRDHAIAQLAQLRTAYQQAAQQMERVVGRIQLLDELIQEEVSKELLSEEAHVSDAP